ncbi:malonate transporter subunit MadM [Oleispirillum naphthae]|uniref:malonate transporter subunit MadM n=1 Tax=Oleispirillum naphthae TaxID=2838853 RepID=UPI0030822E7F
MDFFIATVMKVATKNGLITAFVIVGVVTWLAYFVSKRLTKGRIHGSAIAIVAGLLLAYIGGEFTHGKKGISDVAFFSGIGLMGGGMLRDFCIIATAFGIKLEELKKAGLAGTLAIVVSTFLSFLIGAVVAWGFGYRDAVSLTTIGGGVATFIVGPVTGAALGATSEVIALSIAAGVVKSISVMILTPILAKPFGLTTPAAATVYGGLMGTTSGTAAGLAATNPKLVPYGAMTATFYTGFGCLVGPSICFFIIKAIVG